MAKGTIFDLFIISMIMLLVAISVLVSYYVLNQIANTGTWSATSTSILTSGLSALTMFNYGFVIVFVGVSIATLIFAYMTPQHPIFFVVSLLLIIILMTIVPQYSNAYEIFIADPQISTVAGTFPVINYIMGNLPYFIAGLAFALMFVSYMRWRNEGTI